MDAKEKESNDNSGFPSGKLSKASHDSVAQIFAWLSRKSSILQTADENEKWVECQETLHFVKQSLAGSCGIQFPKGMGMFDFASHCFWSMDRVGFVF
ncbi:MAG: hypothetical protein KJ630_02695 [Proteobacteria bacterium]|nr:hypothetical protein [Pseudomonadota bacterium]